MTKIKSIRKLYKKIKCNIKDDYTDLEKIACIIYILGMSRSFSSKYHWNTEDYKRKFYDNKRKNNIFELHKEQIICITAAKLLKKIAKKFDIDIYYLGAISGIITYDDFSQFLNGEHIIPVYKIDDNSYISVDLERNFDNIQTHKKWFNFGRKDGKEYLVDLDENELSKIMKKIGYINSTEQYFDVYVENIIKKFNGDLESNLEMIVYDEIISNKASELNSSVDIYRYYKKIINKFYNLENSDQKIYIFAGKAKYNMLPNKYCFGIYYKNESKDKIWIWNTKINQFVFFIKEDFEHMIIKKHINIICPKSNGKIFSNLKNSDSRNVVFNYKIKNFFMK